MSDELAQILVVVVSKSGGTKETRNGMLEAEVKFKEKGLQFNKHAVAVTGVGSDLDKYAEKNGARSINADPEDVFHVLRHLASNDSHLRVLRGDEPADDQFSYAD
jgi:hypothetical protein